MKGFTLNSGAGILVMVTPNILKPDFFSLSKEGPGFTVNLSACLHFDHNSSKIFRKIPAPATFSPCLLQKNSFLLVGSRMMAYQFPLSLLDLVRLPPTVSLFLERMVKVPVSPRFRPGTTFTSLASIALVANVNKSAFNTWAVHPLVNNPIQ